MDLGSVLQSKPAVCYYRKWSWSSKTGRPIEMNLPDAAGNRIRPKLQQKS